MGPKEEKQEGCFKGGLSDEDTEGLSGSREL